MFEQSKIHKLLGEKKISSSCLEFNDRDHKHPVIGGRRRDSPKSIYL